MTDEEVIDFFQGHPEIEEDLKNSLIDIRRLSYDPRFEYDLTDMKLGDPLGQGHFGVVLWGKFRDQFVAVKLPRAGRITVDVFISQIGRAHV